MSYSQFETRPQARSKRAFHAKVRTGCLTCKRRRVRCDERKPYCKGCVRLGHKCEYAPPTGQSSSSLLQQTLLLPAAAAAPVPIWTEADSLRVAYYNAFQSYDPTGLSNSEAFTRVIPTEGSSDDVFNNICLSLGALSLSSVAQSLATYDDQSPPSLPPPSDAQHAKAVRYYTTALSRLRERLGSVEQPLPPRTLLLSMVAMAYFEMMQGSIVASCHIRLSCFSVLSDAVISQAQKGDSDRFGLTALYKDDVAVEEIEAVHIRLAVMSLLGSPEQFQRTDQRTVPIPRPSLGKPAHPNTSVELFQTSWNAFARRFESWKLACYWAICLNGTSATIPNFLDDQRVLMECFQSWEKSIEARVKLSRCLSLDMDHLQALKVLFVYVRSMQLLLAPEDEDLQKFEHRHATDMSELARLPLRPTPRYIAGLFFGSWNDFLMDTRLLPMIKFMVLKRKRCTTKINFDLAKLQLDLGEAIWYALKQWYYNPVSLPVRPRISWTLLLGKHYRDVFKKTVNDMSQENESRSCETNTNGESAKD